MKIIPSYHPPSDYRRPTKTQEKVYVPVNDYPEINFSTLTNPLILTPVYPLISLFTLHSCAWQRHMDALLLHLHLVFDGDQKPC